MSVPKARNAQAKRRRQCGVVEIWASAAREQVKAVQAKQQWSLYLPKPELDLHSEVRESHSTSRCHYTCPA